MLKVKQLIEYDEEDNYMILEKAMKVGIKQYEQNEQKEIVDFVLNRLDTNNSNSNCIYISPGDSGKTFIYDYLSFS